MRRPDAIASAAERDDRADPAAAPPRVSVGLIVYNGERYLESSIASLLGQTYRDIELIISDNGSTDGTERIARAAAAADPRVRYVRSERNNGVAWNHNNAASLARGEYFAWAGHDDLQTPNFLESALALLEADPTVVYAYAPTYLMDEDGHVYAKEANRFTVNAGSPSRRFWEQLIVRGGQNFYGLLRVSTLRSIGRHGRTPWAERVLFGELSLRGRFAVIPGTRFYWRRHRGQLTQDWYDPRHSPGGGGRARALPYHRLINIGTFDPDRPAWRRIRAVVYAEYVGGYIAAIQRTPLGMGERFRCYARLGRWMLSHVTGLWVRDPRSWDVETVAVDGIDPTSGRIEVDAQEAALSEG